MLIINCTTCGHKHYTYEPCALIKAGKDAAKTVDVWDQAEAHGHRL